MNLNERVYKTPAVVLRRSEFGESDYLVTLYTPEYGKMRAVAKGARKPTSRRTGQVELYALTHLVLNAGRELPIITQAETEEHFLPLRENLERSVYASHLVELLDQFAYEGESNPPAFSLISSGLGWLCDLEVDARLAARYFEFRLLRVMGFEPSLFECVISGETLTAQDQYFSVAEGGVVLPEYTAGLDVMRLSLSVFKVLRHFSRHEWAAVKLLKLTDAQADELERLLHAYLTYLLERRLKSVSLLPKLQP